MSNAANRACNGRLTARAAVGLAFAVLFGIAPSNAGAQAPAGPAGVDPMPPSSFTPLRNERRGDLVVPAMLRLEAQQPEQQNEFIPVDELPPEDRLAAAPLLIGAYSVVMLAFFGYLLSVARRLGAVQREIGRLESDVRKSGRA